MIDSPPQSTSIRASSGGCPSAADRIVEVGAGTGRLTLELLDRGQEIVAIEPVAAFRQILKRKLAEAVHGSRARVVHGFFDDLPVRSGYADLVIACSVLTPAAGHGGDAGLAEMERVCQPGGCVVIVWPNNIDWLAARGYQYVELRGADDDRLQQATAKLLSCRRSSIPDARPGGPPPAQPASSL